MWRLSSHVLLLAVPIPFVDFGSGDAEPLSELIELSVAPVRILCVGKLELVDLELLEVDALALLDLLCLHDFQLALVHQLGVVDLLGVQHGVVR